jgi:hypothetical protein
VEFTAMRLSYLRANPGHLLAMLPAKFFWLYHTDTSGFYEGALYPPMQSPSPLAAWIAEHERLVEAFTFRYYEVVMALAVIGAIIALLVLRPPWIWPILALPFLLTFFHLFFHAKDRFHIPLDGVLAVLAAIAITEGARMGGRPANREYQTPNTARGRFQS